MLPRSMPHSTGIERTTGQVARPNNAAGSNATSHVSAAPGVSSKTHDHVVKARDPSGASRVRGPAGLAPVARSGGGGQDAKVQIIERPGSRSAPGPGSAVASVQIISRPGQAQAAAQADGLAGVPFGGVPNLLTEDHMMLIGSLLDSYALRVQAVNDQSATAIANGALDALAQMHEALQSLPPQRAHAPAPAPAPAPVQAQPQGQGQTRAQGEVHAPGPQQPTPTPIVAQTSTTILSARPANATPVTRAVDQDQDEHTTDHGGPPGSA